MNVIAYASYCQNDQNGRPVAGYINICPQLLKDPNYDEDKVSKVIANVLRYKAASFEIALMCLLCYYFFNA